MTRLKADDLELLGEPFRLPEGSMGRIASDLTEDGEFIYIPGIEHLWRIRVEPGRLTLDRDWAPRYRTEPGEQGLAWDGCLSDGNLWIMDNGDIDSLRAIFSRRPNGRFDGPDERLSWRRPAPWRGAQRLLRVALQDGRVDAIAPFAAPGGGIIAPPVNVPELGLCNRLGQHQRRPGRHFDDRRRADRRLDRRGPADDAAGRVSRRPANSSLTIIATATTG